MKAVRVKHVNRKSAEADIKRMPDEVSGRSAASLRFAVFLLVMLMSFCMTACGGGGSGSAAAAGSGDAAPAQEGGYEAPEMKTAVFDEESAEGSGGALVDLSSASDGYFAVKVSSDTRIKLIVEKGDEKYIYVCRYCKI